MGRDGLYLANAAVLITHQIDAAFWHEWELFGIPGGAPVNMLMNLPLMFAIVWGARALALGRIGGIVMSWALVGSGAVAIVLHGWFLLAGDDAFRAPVSLGLLAATGVISSLQAAALLRAGPPPNPPGDEVAWRSVASR